jgi:hypothetical protein
MRSISARARFESESGLMLLSVTDYLVKFMGPDNLKLVVDILSEQGKDISSLF